MNAPYENENGKIRLLKAKDVASILHVHVDSIHKWRREGVLPGISRRIGTKEYFFFTEDSIKILIRDKFRPVGKQGVELLDRLTSNRSGT